jgi:3-isopropylmalate/(R)-2-methylmalate dehydratase small subunit
MEAFRQLEAVAVPLPGANIDTDQILPARYLQKPRANNFGAYLFHDARRDAQGAPRADFPLNQAVYTTARILVAGRNFGCGSSREQAVWALFDGGFRAVIAPAFGDIFQSNALKNGLLPVVLPQALVQQLLDTLKLVPGLRLRVDLAGQLVSAPGMPPTPFTVDAFSRHCLLEGLDTLDYTLTQMPAIEAFEHRISET